MKEETKKYDVGVIVGRFQINRLHSEHIAMINEVLARHKKVILFLGVSKLTGTRRNPLDFLTRKAMIEEEFGHKISAIMPVHDNRSDELWSKNLDARIREVEPIGTVALYGSKDSFIPFYSGRFDTIELVPEKMISATEIRKEVSRQIEKDANFRAGVIYGAYNNFPMVSPVIDVAILDGDDILLGRKPNEKKFRFIGGFADVTDGSYEQTVRREAKEETGLEVDEIRYVASRSVDDWRYRKDADRAIITNFYVAKKIFGLAKANDDIVEIKWFKIDSLNKEDLVGEHQPLFEKLIEFLNK